MKGIVRADLHNHLRTGSYMPSGIFNQAIDVARQRLESKGIFALVNFCDRRYEDFSHLKGYERQDLGKALWVPQKEILVVKGQEVPTKSGHLLVLGLDSNIDLASGRTLEDSIKEAREHDGIIILDHPTYKEGIFAGMPYEKIAEFAQKAEGIEVFNGEAELYVPFITPKGANESASRAYIQLFSNNGMGRNLGAVASSDGHSLRELATSYTELEFEDYSRLLNRSKINQELREAIRVSRLKDLYCTPNKYRAFEHMVKLGICLAAEKAGLKKLAWRLG